MGQWQKCSECLLELGSVGLPWQGLEQACEISISASNDVDWQRNIFSVVYTGNVVGCVLEGMSSPEQWVAYLLQSVFDLVYVVYIPL